MPDEGRDEDEDEGDRLPAGVGELVLPGSAIRLPLEPPLDDGRDGASTDLAARSDAEG